jgi:hypothetical protein
VSVSGIYALQFFSVEIDALFILTHFCDHVPVLCANIFLYIGTVDTDISVSIQVERKQESLALLSTVHACPLIERLHMNRER